MSIRLFILFVFISVLKASAQDSTTLQVKQRIVYKTDKAKEIFLVWAMDNWKQPGEKYWPTGTYINNGMAYSPMIRTSDSFYLDLQLPKGIYVDFMIWGSKDKNGNSIEAWDNNWGTNYNIYVDGNTVQRMNDEKLSIAEIKKKPFTIMENGWMILVAGFLFLATGFVIFLYKRKPGYNPGFTANDFIAGLIIAILLLMLLVRLQLNGYLSHKQYLVFGVGYKDTLFMLILSIIVSSLLYIVRNKKGPRIVLQTLFIFLLVGVLIASILNIEIIRQLGKPLTYNWLYYSDFLQAKDAKNAAKAALNPALVRNIIFIITGVLAAGFGFSMIKRRAIVNSKPLLLACCAILVLFVLLSFSQYRMKAFERGKTENPIAVLLSTWINSSMKPGVFSMQVSDNARAAIEKMHEVKTGMFPVSDSITNVVFFMLESTPANLVQPYDTIYKVTPNLEKWKTHSRIYKNMYAHIPTTANAMSSLVSGIYPMISYKSIVNEYPAIKTPSLPRMLKEKGWATSLFFSSDLTYSNMGDYLTNQQIEIAEDFKKISCDFQKFNSSYAQLDGLDDRCIVNRYLTWVDSNHGKHGLSILWTNQTHYPYFFSDEEVKYTDNKELNKYLNALQEVDNAFGALMDGLQRRNMLNNTLVVVLGDHGEAFGTHNQYTHAANIYEENLKVPCFLINPKLFKGETDSRIAAMVDLPSTIAHVLGILKPVEWQGRSILSNNPRSHSFFVGPYSDFLFGSRFENWKLIFNATANDYQLYDVEKDPGELKNVATQNKELVKQEYELLAAWVQYHNRFINSIIK